MAAIGITGDQTTCDWHDDIHTPISRCGAQATAVHQYGCIHEHRTAAPLCSIHAAKLRAWNTECVECRAADGHSCPVYEVSAAPVR